MPLKLFAKIQTIFCMFFCCLKKNPKFESLALKDSLFSKTDCTGIYHNVYLGEWEQWTCRFFFFSFVDTNIVWMLSTQCWDGAETVWYKECASVLICLPSPAFLPCTFILFHCTENCCTRKTLSPHNLNTGQQWHHQGDVKQCGCHVLVSCFESHY